VRYTWIAGTALLVTLGCFGAYHWVAGDPVGWTCSKYGPCEPNGGRWGALKIGMTHDEALKAACGMLKEGVIATEDEARHEVISFAGYPVEYPMEVVGGSCRAKDYELDTKAPIWLVSVKHEWCIPWMQRRIVFVEFDDNNTLTGISMHCAAPYL
jgi:hypothetical protein